MDSKYSDLSPAKQALFAKWKKGKFNSETIPKRSNTELIPLSFPQQRLWFIDQLYQGSSFYNIVGVLHLKGALNVIALKQSLNEIMRRHEIWRTSFVLVDRQPVQAIASPSELTWELPIIDLQHLGNDWEAKVECIAREEGQKPFDLSQKPLIRAKLLRLNQEEYVLLLTMHHIVTDGWSIGVFERELATLYAAFSQNRPSPLPELPIQYADFAIWQNLHLPGELFNTQLNYWKQQLSGDLPVLKLPSHRPRPSVAAFKGAKQCFTFSPTLTAGLHQLSQQEQVTLFMTLLAAFSTLLYRYTNQEDILIGSSIANRKRPELEPMLGLFVNTLVFRNDLSGNPTFRELLSRVREVTLNAYAHQDLPFEQLVETLQPERDLSRNPLFQVMFVLQNTPQTVQEIPGLTLRSLEMDSGTAQFDLFLSITKSKQNLTGFLEYSTDLFDAETITCLIENFQTLLTGIVANPERKISQLPLLTSQQQQILTQWNNTQADYPQTTSLDRLFNQQVEQTPDNIALISPTEKLTYQQLNQKVNQLANYLQKLGVTQETIVAICLERSVEIVIAILAILKAGGAYLPLDPNYPVERLNFMLSDSKSTLIISHSSLLTQVDKITDNLAEIAVINLDQEWQNIQQKSNLNPSQISTAENTAYIIYTSGSTGTPKGVLGTHKGTVNGLHWLWQKYPFSTEEICCQKTAISFVDSVWEIFAPLLQGIPTVIFADSIVRNPQLFLESLAENRVTRVVLVPSLLRVILESYGHLTTNLTELKVWITSGEAISLELVNKFRELMPNAKLINLYGSSEVSANVTYYDTNLLSEKATSVPIGRPINNTQIYVLDGYLQPTPVGIVGELYVGGDGLAKEYWQRPNLTQERFIDNPFFPGSKLFKTGDLGRYLPDGNLEYLGRIDEQIKIRGFRVELGEVKQVIVQYPAIQDAVAIATKFNSDTAIAAYLVTDEPDVLPQLNDYLREKLPEYMIPSAFTILEEIPLTPNGKVDKQALPKNNLLRLSSHQSFVAPRTFTELALAKIWSKLLNVKSVGVKDNFFALGGHSFLTVRLMAQIYEVFGHNLPLSTLFENPTIEQLANILNNQPEGLGLGSPLVAIQPAGDKLPFFCVHAAGGDITAYLNLAQKLDKNRPFYALEQTPNQLQEKPQSVEETAAYYLEEIRQVQPTGPYFLGGWCYGGVVAFEMAQQLLRQGEKVSLLVIIDAILPQMRIKPSKDDDAKFLLRLAESIKTWFGIEFDVSYQELRDLPLNEQFALLNQKANLTASDRELAQHLRNYQLFKAHVQAMRSYQPQVYPYHITLFKAIEKITHDFDSTEFESSDRYFGWSPYSQQPIQTKSIPGNHFSMFTEPHVEELAKQLQMTLNNV
ncbi:non-ribosomal peptide synthetase [Oscillatoria salina]|uniref:non-ribosomal peptide synthetase n=1 Tax=Oscillatoria salina TaxID=331517 RepID=UPI001CCDBC95|nr:non-ribosomal peptide synthetase [Oscillatoria salina]MBZ8179842.1 amino acid adenylation domain-containing protein [Oscillatoria salina IIICB1]